MHGTATESDAGAAHSYVVQRSTRGDWRDTLDNWNAAIEDWFAHADLAPDLATDLFSARWWRGLATLFGLLTLCWFLLPDYGPIPGLQPPSLSEESREELRSQMILPLALGADSGRHTAPGEQVTPLENAPERPRIQMDAALGENDSLPKLLQRAGVARDEVGQVMAIVGDITDPAEIAPGTKVDITLGKRQSEFAPRPLDRLAFRARLDLGIAIQRVNGRLSLTANRIAVDNTPLRISGTVGDSIYANARASGAPPRAIEEYLLILEQQYRLGNVRPTDRFDIILSHRRAETGESEAGSLVYAGLERDGRPLMQMLKWRTGDGGSQWFEASGVGKSRGEFARPVNGPVSSRYGMRMHPILHYKRMHSGLDFSAGTGEPIHATANGTVVLAGRNGGYGNYVKIDHGGGLATGYAHMSRFAVSNGDRVKQGQIIGYVGSTGLSTGPHLHYELYRNGAKIDPASVRFTESAQLSGDELRAFRGELARLKSVKPGAALARLPVRDRAPRLPKREIDRLGPASVN